jgi:hypothetical protein
MQQLSSEQKERVAALAHRMVEEVWGNEAPFSCHRYALLGCTIANWMLGYERYLFAAGSLVVVADPSTKTVLEMNAHEPIVPLQEFHAWFVGFEESVGVTEWIDLSTRHFQYRCLLGNCPWNRSIPDYVWGDRTVMEAQQVYLVPEPGLAQQIYADMMLDSRMVFALRLTRDLMNRAGLIACPVVV